MPRRSSLLLSLVIASSASAVTIDWTFVGIPNKDCDPNLDGTGRPGCYGSVGYVYRIGTYEVTNAQYAEFLNAIARTDTNSLYHLNMGEPELWGGITRAGDAGNYTYEAIAGRENLPVSFVSFVNALRFANWLNNDQPTGPQDATTTEDGSYTITAQGILDNTIARNSNGRIFVPSEDEWYKAAYYDHRARVYYDYPTGTDTPTTCTTPTATPNCANCERGLYGDLTDVGSYTGSASPYGTFDQGGNVLEWNDTKIFDQYRGLRGGQLISSEFEIWSGFRGFGDVFVTSSFIGFRVAKIHRVRHREHPPGPPS